MVFSFSKNEVKSCFTLAEALITLVIIGVVSSVTIPVLNLYKNNTDSIVYKKAVKNVGNAFYEATIDAEVFLSKYNWKDCPETYLCEKMAEKLIIKGGFSCSTTVKSSYDNPNFITYDNIRYWGLEDAFVDGIKVIYVDRELKNTENRAEFLSRHRDSYHSAPGFKIALSAEGNIIYPDTDDYNLEKNILDI